MEIAELEEILNDDLLKCEVVADVENEGLRASLVKWTHSNTFQVAVVLKLTGNLTLSKEFVSEEKAKAYFKRNYE